MGELRLNEGSSLRIEVPTGYPEEIQAMARELIELRTEPDKRNQGYASSLLAQVCEEADEAGIALLVHCQPEDCTTDSKRLQSFYARHGFAVFQKSPLLMCRTPNGGKA